MSIDKKKELYQLYKQLENKLVIQQMYVNLLKFLIVLIWFLMFCMGFITIPDLNKTNLFDSKLFRKEICRLDSTYTTGRRASTTTNYLILVQDTILPFEQRKERVILMYGNIDFVDYLTSMNSKKNIDFDEVRYDSIPLWVNKKYAYLIQQSSPNKINFTEEKIMFTIFLLSFPFYYFFIFLFWKKWKKYKGKFSRKVIIAKQNWQNY